MLDRVYSNGRFNTSRIQLAMSVYLVNDLIELLLVLLRIQDVVVDGVLSQLCRYRSKVVQRLQACVDRQCAIGEVRHENA